jgi:hypothetical protein
VIIVLVLAVVAASLPKSNSSVSYTLVPAGTVYTVAPGQYDYSAFGLPPPTGSGQTLTYTLTGAFTATVGVTLYIMNYTSFTSSALGTSYIYTSGNVTSATISISDVPVGNAYYLVFLSTDATANSTVTVTQAIVASGTPQG